MLQVLSGVKAETVSNVLPKELSVVINDLLADMPTHVLQSTLVKYLLPPNAGSHSSRRTTSSLRAPLCEPSYSSILYSCHAKVGW